MFHNQLSMKQYDEVYVEKSLASLANVYIIFSSLFHISFSYFLSVFFGGL